MRPPLFHAYNMMCLRETAHNCLHVCKQFRILFFTAYILEARIYIYLITEDKTRVASWQAQTEQVRGQHNMF
jgi:hypothetical protein